MIPSQQDREQTTEGAPHPRVGWSHVFWVLVALGLGLRLFHYLSNPPVWHDEQALIWNALTKQGTELLGALHYSEAAPPLFLILERSAYLLLGDNTLALRLIPFLATCAAFLLLAGLARTALDIRVACCFVFLLACSDRLLWHACEAKPYAVDFLLGAGLLLLAQLSQRSTKPSTLCWILVGLGLASPVMVFLSFPACFLLGGMALTLLPAVWNSRRVVPWLALGWFGILLCGSFLVLLLGPIRAQRDEYLMNCWVDNFPDWQRPWTVPVRAIQRVTEAFRYAQEPIGNVLSLLAIPGAIVLMRSGRQRLLAQCLLPLALTLFAWIVGQYPLGSSRVCVFLAPGLLLLVAAGVPVTWAWLNQFGRWTPAGLALLLLVPLGVAGLRVAQPWNRLDSTAPAQFVLQQRDTTEPVVGTRWEHLYYFRQLGDAYRPLVRKNTTEPPGLPPTTRQGLSALHTPETGQPVDSLWLLGNERGDDGTQLLKSLSPAGNWRIEERFSFRDLEVYHVRRVD